MGANCTKIYKNYGETLAGFLLIDSVHANQFEEFEKANLDIIPAIPTRDIVFLVKNSNLWYPAYFKDVAYLLVSTDKIRSFLFNELRNLDKKNA